MTSPETRLPRRQARRTVLWVAAVLLVAAGLTLVVVDSNRRGVLERAEGARIPSSAEAPEIALPTTRHGGREAAVSPVLGSWVVEVVDLATQEPIGGVKVTEPGQADLLTDDRGFVWIPCTNGVERSFSFRHPEYFPRTIRASDLALDSSTVKRVVLSPRGELNVTVLAKDGSPVEGAYIEVLADVTRRTRPEGWPRTRRSSQNPWTYDEILTEDEAASAQVTETDVQGKTTIRGLPTGLPFDIFATGACVRSIQSCTIDPRSRRADVVLYVERGAVVRGRIVEDSGKPVSRGTLRLWQPGPPDQAPPLRIAPTDKEGRFQFAGVPYGTVHLQGITPPTDPRVVDVKEPVVDVEDLVVPASRPFHVRVLSKWPIGRADRLCLWLYRKSVLLEAFSAVWIGNIPISLPAAPDYVQLTLSLSQWMPPRPIDARIVDPSTTNEVEFDLDRALGAVSGVLETWRGDDRSTVSVELRPKLDEFDPSSGPSASALTIDSVPVKGRAFALGAILPATYDVTVRSGGETLLYQRNVIVRAGHETRLEAHRAATADLSGIVRLEADEPVSGARVLAAAGGRTLSTLSDSSGAFRFANLGAGTWLLTAEAGTRLTREPVSVDLDAGTRHGSVELRLAEGAGIDVSCTDAAGRPVSGVAVDVVRIGPFRSLDARSITTDSSGGASLSGIHAGRYVVCFSAQSCQALFRVTTQWGERTRVPFVVERGAARLRFVRGGDPVVNAIAKAILEDGTVHSGMRTSSGVHEFPVLPKRALLVIEEQESLIPNRSRIGFVPWDGAAGDQTLDISGGEVVVASSGDSGFPFIPEVSIRSIAGIDLRGVDFPSDLPMRAYPEPIDGTNLALRGLQFPATLVIAWFDGEGRWIRVEREVSGPNEVVRVP